MTTETQHSPIPFHVSGGGTRILNTMNDSIGGCWTSSAIPTLDEAKANARFIVQACNAYDDLLAACEAWLKVVDASGSGNCCGCNYHAETEQTRRAIAKATNSQEPVRVPNLGYPQLQGHMEDSRLVPDMTDPDTRAYVEWLRSRAKNTRPPA